MKKVDTVLKLAVSLVWLCASAFASSEYVIVNNNNYISNSAVLYSLDTATGTLTKTAVLHTSGQGLQTGNVYYYQIEQAVTRDAGCIFVFDTGSSDIATFSKSAGYRRVGRYFNSDLIANFLGGTLALAPNGKFLYASYSETGNLGAWSVNSGCTLTFVANSGYLSDVGPLRVTPNGKYLLANAGGGVAEFAVDNHTGDITYIGTTIHGRPLRPGKCVHTVRVGHHQGQ